MEYTRGPWSCYLGKNGVIRGADGSIVTNVEPWDTSWTKPEDIGNCKLIAAAPEMYELLLKMQYPVPSNKETVERYKQLMERLK